MKTTFIYGLYSDSDNIIRYIGKSDNPNDRLKRHIYQRNDSNTHKNNWIKKLIKNNQKLKCKIIEEVNYNDWQEKEKYWISQYENLVNTSEGGIGGRGIKYNISYKDCKKWVNNNLANITSRTMWFKNTKNLTEFIPKNPREAFLKRGWVSWGDFLGTNRIQSNKVNYISYNDAKIWIIKNKISINNYKEWKTINLPFFLPKRPDRFYKKRGWISWADFLSNNRIQNQKKKLNQSLNIS